MFLSVAARRFVWWHGSPDPCFVGHGSGDPCHMVCPSTPLRALSLSKWLLFRARDNLSYSFSSVTGWSRCVSDRPGQLCMVKPVTFFSTTVGPPAAGVAFT